MRRGATGSVRTLAAVVAVLAALSAGAIEAPEEEGLELFPSEQLYRPYLADPRVARFGLTVVGVRRVDVPESGASRFGLHMGGELGLLRVPRTALGPLQVGFVAGFRGQFDRTEGSDNIAWDGIYGLMVNARPRPDLALRAGLHHTSAHLGDEYTERTGAQRIGYTREEAVLGVSLDRGPWRLYGEGGWAFERRIAWQEPLRLQAGAERRAGLGGVLGLPERFGWYAALDLSTFEERGWDVDVGLAAGLLVLAPDRVWRVGVALHDGRVPLGELAVHDEQWIEVGLWMDL